MVMNYSHANGSGAGVTMAISQLIRRWQRAGVMMVVMNYSHDDGGGLV